MRSAESALRDSRPPHTTHLQREPVQVSPVLAPARWVAEVEAESDVHVVIAPVARHGVGARPLDGIGRGFAVDAS